MCGWIYTYIVYVGRYTIINIVSIGSLVQIKQHLCPHKRLPPHIRNSDWHSICSSFSIGVHCFLLRSASTQWRIQLYRHSRAILFNRPISKFWDDLGFYFFGFNQYLNIASKGRTEGKNSITQLNFMKLLRFDFWPWVKKHLHFCYAMPHLLFQMA